MLNGMQVALGDLFTLTVQQYHVIAVRALGEVYSKYMYLLSRPNTSLKVAAIAFDLYLSALLLRLRSAKILYRILQIPLFLFLVWSLVVDFCRLGSLPYAYRFRGWGHRTESYSLAAHHLATLLCFYLRVIPGHVRYGYPVWANWQLVNMYDQTGYLLIQTPFFVTQVRYLDVWTRVSVVSSALTCLEVLFQVGRYTRLIHSALTNGIFGALIIHSGIPLKFVHWPALFKIYLPLCACTGLWVVVWFLGKIHLQRAADKGIQLEKAVKETWSLDWGKTLEENYASMALARVDLFTSLYEPELAGATQDVTLSSVESITVGTGDSGGAGLPQRTWSPTTSVRPSILKMAQGAKWYIPLYEGAVNSALWYAQVFTNPAFFDLVGATASLISLLFLPAEDTASVSKGKNGAELDDDTCATSDCGLGTCIVCLAEPRSVVIWPCGCLCVCVRCKSKLDSTKCVACQRPALSCSRIRIP